MKIFVVTVFVITYFCVIFFNRRINPLIPLFAGIALLLTSEPISLRSAFLSVDFNVMGIFLGTIILSELFIRSNVPGFLAVKLIDRSKTVGGAFLWVCLLSGVISAVAENVATVLIVAPIAFEVSRKLKVNPIPFIIGIAVSSNLQGSATMIGDPPSIILAIANKMNFMDFFWMKGRPGIAFAVEAGAITSFLVLYFIFRKYKAPVAGMEEIKVKTWVPTYLMLVMIAGLALSSLIPEKPYYLMAAICLVCGIAGFIWNKISNKERFSLFKSVDWNTFAFLIGVFILVGSLSAVGIIEDIARFIAHVTGDNVFLTFTLIVWTSVFFSAFIDNIPYVTAMIPVVKILSDTIGIMPELFLFGLLIGATVGGNITPIGASANIVSVGMLRDRGYKVDFMDFVKIGLPFTLAAVSASYLFLWLFWR